MRKKSSPPLNGYFDRDLRLEGKKIFAPPPKRCAPPPMKSCLRVYNCTFSFTTAQTGHNCPLKYTLHYAEEITIKAMEGEGDGVKVGCKFLQDVRFTDDHGMVADRKSGLQKIMERLSATAE